MKAIILAGGLGTRLRDIVQDVPKPMAPVGGKPFLEYLILQLVRWDIREIVISTGYKGDVIKSYFGDGGKWGVKIDYSEEESPLGTGGALKKAARMVDDHQFILMNGDSFINIDFGRFIDFHDRKKAAVTMSLVHVTNMSRYGEVKVNENGKVYRFVEKSVDGEGYINAGVYLLDRKIISRIPDGKVSLEREILPLLIGPGVHAMTVDGFFMDIGTPIDYLKICREPGDIKKAVRLVCDTH
jgi:D-glycero-alpha-D-manno-heptose 1-phosphate guanylyltransferase